MGRGRPRQPNSRRVGRGDYGSLPPVATGLPPCPMELDDIAGGLWKEVAENAPKLGIALLDAAAVQGVCELWSLYRRSLKIANDDPVDKDARIAVTSYWQAFITAAARLGMTPTDRLKLAGTIKSNDDPQNPLLKFLPKSG